MLKNFIVPALLALAVFFQSCDGYEKTETGLKYKIVVDSAGEPADTGDMAIVHMIFENEKDTFNTVKRGMPIQILLQPSPMKSSFEKTIEEGISLLSEGDSAVFLLSNDSLYANRDSLPKGVKAGSFLEARIKVVKIYTKDEMQKEQEAEKKQQEDQEKQAYAQLAKDTMAIKEYLSQKKIKPTGRTQLGVYYVIHKKGKGEKISQGDSVTVNYTGKLLDGKEFDSSKERGPFTFIPGVSQVILGWHEVATQLVKGDKVTAYIPSIIGYGPQGSPPVIPPDANLIFEMEVLDVKKYRGRP
jgi:FKBP-type peptidyl-prolyl cis-trans isomerase FkpA